MADYDTDGAIGPFFDAVQFQGDHGFEEDTIPFVVPEETILSNCTPSQRIDCHPHCTSSCIF